MNFKFNSHKGITLKEMLATLSVLVHHEFIWNIKDTLKAFDDFKNK